MASLVCAYCYTHNQPPARICKQCGAALVVTVELARGQVINNRYRLDEVYQPGAELNAAHTIGPFQPGFSRTLWRVTDLTQNRQVLIREYELEEGSTLAGMMDKLSAFVRLRHPHIAAILDIVDFGDRLLVVMEYTPGVPLESFLAAHPHGIAEPQGIIWGMQLCDVLGYLHAQKPPIIYRDLKPANVLISEHGRVHLVDFGYARLFRSHKLSDTRHMGTPGYVAPEMYAYEQTDARSDVYSIGATLHHMLTGHNPVKTFPLLPPAREVNPALSPAIEAVIDRATRRVPAERYQTAGELYLALRACQAQPAARSSTQEQGAA